MMNMKSTTKIETVEVPLHTVYDALHFLKRVVVHGTEQHSLMDAYASLMQSLNKRTEV